MAYRQYTSCVSPGNFVDLGSGLVGIGQTLLLVLTMGFIAFFLASIVGLHCEFEGDGIYTLLLEAIIIFALLTAALIFPQAAIGLAILAAIIFLIGLLGDWLLATPGGPGAGDPTDIDPSLGTLAKGN